MSYFLDQKVCVWPRGLTLGGKEMTLHEAARLSEKDVPEGVLCLSISATLLKQLLDRTGDLEIERVDATPAEGLKINLIRAVAHL